MDSSDSIVRKKVELQSRGVCIPPELVAGLETSYNAPSVRTGRIVLCLESPKNDGELLPVFIVNGKRASASPLHLVKKNQKQYEVWADGHKYVDVSLLPRPTFYDSVTPGGTPASKLAVIVALGHLRSIVSQDCCYQRAGLPCKFCAVRYWWDAGVTKAAPDIAAIVAAGAKDGVVKHISLTTATLDTPAKGLENLVETARLINSKVSLPMMLEFEPIADFSLLEHLLQEARAVGVTTASCNIECYEKRLRPEIMPAKGRIPVAHYIKTWEKCLETFGKNEVFTVAIAGIGESDDSLLKGVEMAASRGVMTFLVPHSPAIGAIYEDMPAPSADRMLSLYVKAVEIFNKFGLDICASRAGCAHGGGFSAIKDVARFGV